MKDMAKRAGFEFVASSEVNVPADFDAELFKNIGESDRATLKFRKPL